MSDVVPPAPPPAPPGPPRARRAWPATRPEKPQGLPIQRRLRRSGEFIRTEKQGRRVQGTFVVVIAKPGRGRVGFTVSKKVGNAVARNHVKRRLRDIARRHKELWLRRDLVIVARPDAAGRDLAELEADVLSALAKLDAARDAAPGAAPGAPGGETRKDHGKTRPPRG